MCCWSGDRASHNGETRAVVTGIQLDVPVVMLKPVIVTKRLPPHTVETSAYVTACAMGVR